MFGKAKKASEGRRDAAAHQGAASHQPVPARLRSLRSGAFFQAWREWNLEHSSGTSMASASAAAAHAAPAVALGSDDQRLLGSRRLKTAVDVLVVRCGGAVRTVLATGP